MGNQLAQGANGNKRRNPDGTFEDVVHYRNDQQYPSLQRNDMNIGKNRITVPASQGNQKQVQQYRMTTPGVGVKNTQIQEQQYRKMTKQEKGYICHSVPANYSNEYKNNNKFIQSLPPQNR